MGITRRELSRWALGTVATSALLETLFRNDAFAESVRPITEGWLVELNGLCADLRGRKLKPTEWQDQMERLFARVPLEDLLRHIDFDRIIRGLKLPREGAEVVPVRFPQVEGLPEFRRMGRKIFALADGRAIVPHGHVNMVSMHVVLKGRLRLRHYDKLAEELGHLVLRPTIDRMSGAGEASTISDDRNNVHWLVAQGGPAFTFDVVVDALEPSHGFPYRMDFVDPDRAEKLDGERLRMPRITVQEALKRYG